MFIHGIDITLYETTQTGSDEFGAPIYSTTPVIVKNVLVGQPSSKDVIDELQLSGKKIQYTLSIPKGDTHDWENKEVEFFGERFKTFGKVSQYIEDLVPLSWNKQIKVEAYE